MVAKGHDFPDVTLAVVLDADGTLRFPDFRAEERTFSLVAQLAGRAGRGPGSGSDPGGQHEPGAEGLATPAGRVLVQTLAPDASCLRFAARHDAEGFLAAELERRRALAYPPFADLIRIVCSSPAREPADRAAAALAERIGAPGTTLLGPAPLFRLRGRERFQLVLKTTRRREAVLAVGAAVEATATERAHRGVSFGVDVDPQ
jgi:primosomal protein N' (replication factor Y)